MYTGREMLSALRNGNFNGSEKSDPNLFMCVQSPNMREVRFLPKVLVEAAYVGYDVMGHSNQTLKRLQQRAGFGIGEAMYYLAFAVLSGRVKIVFTNEEHERKLLDREIGE